ncbi:hypothetical protein AB4455_19495 [Vibrio sp. 10N.261.46.E12]|uniref:hypothetical protein n=1 Tax=unclassified Vibrio TaxID=2614977 RepID=UPI000978A71F|nr:MULTISPECIES: hypothetical protein [unclassified Vibrio]OMO33837.1 hypothetical protein BH584_00595 [Vibrio sp. 10N.261.45.E1]PMJ19335.1 hypothetical protein BCU27_21660 [Vibrio sp. 10N.286.45.B6]PML97974.1 hypothetical protein BCT66_20620 [Vibrio sp. 10N.261.49.E11]PMM83128.1 hypothetical protein BCT46_02315 [Vibrio sp. 10N.261.46.E8]PMN59090.1 hypothetical protein BCT32_22365 [Vibrio sp. 10N.261.45.E11]
MTIKRTNRSINRIVKIYTLVAIAGSIFGCSTAPSPKYNVAAPIQVTTDLLKETRHFYVQGDYKPSFLEDLLDKNPVTLINDQDWQQLFLKTDINAEKSYRLEENLRRTCWAIKDDAELKIKSRSHRGADYDNILTACISKRLGDSYPLFFYSYVQDVAVGNYLMMLTPKEHYTDQGYLCKAKAEGYDLSSNLFCETESPF